MGRFLLCLLFAGIGSQILAAKVCETGPTAFPGVDETGDCSFALGVVGEIKICVSDSGKWKVSGKAQVQNESGETLKLHDSPAVLECLDAEGWISEDEVVSRALYKVSKSGKAKLLGKGTGGKGTGGPIPLE